MTYQLLIIDLDGTLVDSFEDIHSSIVASRKHFSLPPVKKSAVKECVGTGIRPLLEEGLQDSLRSELWEYFSAEYLKQIGDKTTVYPGWDKVFELTQERVILTNKDGKFAKRVFEKLVLGRFFSELYHRNSFEKRKPDPLPVEKIAEIHGIAKSKILMIGDTETDILSAQAAGVDTCLVHYGFGLKEELSKLSPNFNISTVEELIPILKATH